MEISINEINESKRVGKKYLFVICNVQRLTIFCFWTKSRVVSGLDCVIFAALVEIYFYINHSYRESGDRLFLGHKLRFQRLIRCF